MLTCSRRNPSSSEVPKDDGKTASLSLACNHRPSYSRISDARLSGNERLGDVDEV